MEIPAGPDGFEAGAFGAFKQGAGHPAVLNSSRHFSRSPREQRLARLDAIAKLLDVAFVVPGTNIRYGIDGLIGLVPVIGDIITTAFSLWLVREARALGAPWHITARMLSNVAVDGVVGLVPVAGDAFDVMFRANVRNVRDVQALAGTAATLEHERELEARRQRKEETGSDKTVLSQNIKARA